MTNERAQTELAERCEKATGPDPYLDEAIMDALFERRPFVQLADAPEGTGFRAWRVDGQTQSAYRLTASLDAAMTLVPEGWQWSIVSDGCSTVFKRRETGGISAFESAEAATPALALCAAALRARSQ